MQSLDRQIFYIGLLLPATVIICGVPTLEPAPTLHSCPGQIVTYTCQDALIHFMQWIVEPFIPENDPIIYVANQLQDMQLLTIKRANISTSLTHITHANGNLANMTTNATVNTCQLENGTNINCRTFRGGVKYDSYSTLYIADVPYWKYDNLTYQTRETYFTAVLQLGDMFGGGVPIDHYIIQVDNDTELETTGPTYSFNISYHTTLLVNISAHNCAGYSDVIIFHVQYDQASVDSMDTADTTDTTTLLYSRNYSTNTADYDQDDSSTLLYVAVPASFGIFSSLLAMLSLCKIFHKYHKSRSRKRGSKGYSTRRTNITCDKGEMMEIQQSKDTSTSAQYSRRKVPSEVTHCIQGTDLPQMSSFPEPSFNMDDNPLYNMASVTSIVGQSSSFHVYETVGNVDQVTYKPGKEA